MQTTAREAAAVGAGAALLATAVAELAAGVVPGTPSLLDAASQVVLDRLPGTTATAALAVLGPAGRPLVLATAVVVVAGLGALVGQVARLRPLLAAVLVVLAAAAGATAALQVAGARPPGVLLAAALAVAAGLGVLRRLSPRAGEPAADPVTEPGAGGPAADPTTPPYARRAVLRTAATVAAGAVVVGVAGRALTRPGPGRVDPTAVALPAPARALPDLLPGHDLAAELDGVTPAFTPLERFFRIDTALVVPSIEPDTWRLRIHGRVEREVEIDYATLLGLPMTEVDATIACVSNEVGGDLIGTARWLGVPLEDVLALAGVRDDAEQLIGRSVDGWTAGFPVEQAFDGRRALVAVGMQGQALPTRHGFPARLVVPGLFGYVSATKWLTELELTSWDDVDAYWVPRGWAKQGPVKTAARIDRPRDRAEVPAGDTVVAGVAWAPTRGIAEVEVQVDEGPWQPARLVPVETADVWVQWWLQLPLAAGEHRLRVRCTDGDGQPQPPGPRPAAPDGAEGWHEVQVVAAG